MIESPSNSTPPASTARPTRRWLAIGATAVVSALGGAAIAGGSVGAVSADDAPTTPAASIQLAAQTSDTDTADTDATTDDAAALDCEALFDDVFGVVEWTPTPEELAEINAEGQELAALLDAAGASYEMVTDDLGITYPEPADEAGWEIVDGYYEDKHGEMVLIDDGEFEAEMMEPTAEELAEWQTEADEVRALLDAAGASYETVTEFGLTFPEPTDDAGWAIVDQYFVDKYGDDVVNIDLDEMDLSELDLDGEFGIDGGVVVAGEALELTDEELAQLEECEKEFFGDLEGCEVIDLDGTEFDGTGLDLDELPADETEAVPAA